VEYTYTYDANGNIVSDSLGGTLKHSYVYDEAGQLKNTASKRVESF